MSTTASYWCYRCTRIVRLTPESAVVCPHCAGEFIESVDSHVPSPPPSRRRSMRGTNERPDLRLRRVGRRNTSARSPFNPVIVLRRADAGSDRVFELYYDDGTGTGLQPLPPAMSEFLIGSGSGWLLGQLSQMEISGLGPAEHEHPPASKSAVESMPVIEISDVHVSTDLHCGVCKEAFAIGDEAREMPCDHIYHPDCILPWLKIRNSCPICRNELPTDSTNSNELEQNEELSSSSSSTVGLTVWRLPGGGFAVGRVAGRREVPVVYTEMEGGLNNAPRRIVWGSGRNRSTGEGGFGRAFRNVFGFFRRRSSSVSNGELMNRIRSLSNPDGESP